MPSSEHFSGTRQSRGHWEQQTQSLPRLWWVQSPQWWDWEGRKTLSQCLCVCWVSRRLHAHWGGPVSGPSELPPHTFHPYPRARAVQLVMGWNAGRAWGPSVVVIFFFFLTKVFFFFLWILYWGEKAMAPHPVLLPGKSRGRWSLVGCSPWDRYKLDWATSLSLFTFMHWRRKWQPTPEFLPGESQGRGSLVGCRLWGCTELDMTEAT